MTKSRWRAVLALPFNALVMIPALLLWWRDDASLAASSSLRMAAALLFFTAGTALMVSTIRRFDREGDGSLAPWNPTQQLVVSGVYRHVRNPMITGVVANLLGEVLLSGSAALTAWTAIFALGNAIYMPLVEEPGLEARFGDAYRRYRGEVPRWIPRCTAYRG